MAAEAGPCRDAEMWRLAACALLVVVTFAAACTASKTALDAAEVQHHQTCREMKPRAVQCPRVASAGSVSNSKVCRCLDDCREVALLCGTIGVWRYANKSRDDCSVVRSSYFNSTDPRQPSHLIVGRSHSYSCPRGFRLHGPAVRFCSGGTLSGAPPTCLPAGNDTKDPIHVSITTADDFIATTKATIDYDSSTGEATMASTDSSRLAVALAGTGGSLAALAAGLGLYFCVRHLRKPQHEAEAAEIVGETNEAVQDETEPQSPEVDYMSMSELFASFEIELAKVTNNEITN